MNCRTLLMFKTVNQLAILSLSSLGELRDGGIFRLFSDRLNRAPEAVSQKEKAFSDRLCRFGL